MQLRTEHIYREFLRLTRRLSNSQIMMLLAVVVGILAGLGTYLFEILLHGIKSGLIRWFPVVVAPPTIDVQQLCPGMRELRLDMA